MSKTRARSSRRKRAAQPRNGPTAAALRAMVRPLVRKIVAEELGPIQDRLDFIESEASLADGRPIPAEEVWKELGL